MHSTVDVASLHRTPDQVVQQILTSGKITAAERLWFHALTRSDISLTGAELAQIRLVFDRLQMGLIKVVD
ncbi:MAG: hypothetical protein IGS38_24350 [Synechococcales cyanobacterium M58_A2018_015]|nr:hypothetical protein [Synechococcales cyanobacterium M58_A2018_015]